MAQKLLTRIKYCSCCGAKVLLLGYDSQNRITRMMKQKGICYECAFWQDVIDYPPEYLEVIDGRCLRIHPVADSKDKTLILGGKGKMRYFMRPDQSLFQSNDIWVIGSIPQRFRDRFSSTATEITAKAYGQLERTDKKCYAKACFDRYHCYRYNQEQEKDGAYNSIPPKWKIGDEHCGFFIDKKDILNDDSSVK